MGNYEEFDKQLSFFVQTNMSSFLFIKISTTADYDHVKTFLSNKAAIDIIILNDNVDILEYLKHTESEKVLVYVDPCSETVLHRMNYVRDSIHMIGKMFIFVFHLSQYENLMHEYPDFFSYAGAYLCCESSVSSPFILSFSCDVLDYRPVQQYSWYVHRLKAHRSGKSYDLEDIQTSISRLKRVRMNQLELKELNDQINNLYKLNGFIDTLVFKNLSESVNIQYYYIVVVDTIMDYISALVAKEKYDLAKQNLLDLCHFLQMMELEKDGEFSDISYVISFCKGIASDDHGTYRKVLKAWVNDIIKIIISCVVHISSEIPIDTLIDLNNLRFALCKSVQLGVKDLAQCYNDAALLMYLKTDTASFSLNALENMSDLAVDFLNMFLCYYNKVLFLLFDYRYAEAYSVCNKFLDLSQQVTYNENIFEVRMKLIKNWIVGVYDRKLIEAIQFNLDVLDQHRKVFSENHYSIAEIHYCNAFLYRELGDIEKSKHCLHRACNILKNIHSVKLGKLKELVESLEI